MSLARIAATVALIAGLFAVVAPAGAARRAEATHRVKLGFSLDRAFTPSPRSKTVHLKVVQRGCGPVYERALLRRSVGRLTITLLSRPWSPPLKGAVCPDYVAIRPIAVAIGPPLGGRAIYDGAASPPRQIYPG